MVFSQPLDPIADRSPLSVREIGFYVSGRRAMSRTCAAPKSVRPGLVAQHHFVAAAEADRMERVPELGPAEAAPFPAAEMRPTVAPVVPTRPNIDRAGVLAGDLWARTGVPWKQRCKANSNLGGASLAHTTCNPRLR